MSKSATAPRLILSQIVHFNTAVTNQFHIMTAPAGYRVVTGGASCIEDDNRTSLILQGSRPLGPDTLDTHLIKWLWFFSVANVAPTSVEFFLVCELSNETDSLIALPTIIAN